MSLKSIRSLANSVAMVCTQDLIKCDQRACGPDLGMPHTRSMGGGLLELRLKANEGIARVFYCVVIGRKIMMCKSLDLI